MSPWTQFRFDAAADGFNTAEATLNTSNVGGLKLAWKFKTNGSIYGGNAAVANGIVYVGSQGGGFYALNETTGKLLWSFITTNLIDGAPVFDATNGSVYFSSFDSNVYAFDAVTCGFANGKCNPKWTFASAGPVEGGMNLSGGVLYATSLSPNQAGPGSVYALDPTNGHVLHTTTAGGPIESSPAVANGVVYVGSEDKKLHAYDLSLNELWSYSTGSAVDSSPAVANGIVFFGADNGNEYAVNTSFPHNLVWSFHTGRFLESSAGIQGSRLIIGSADNNIYGLDLASGTPLWPAIKTGLQIESSPAVANGIACIGSRDTHMRCLDITNGNVLYTSNFATKSSNASPSIADGMVFMGSNDHTFYAYKL